MGDTLIHKTVKGRYSEREDWWFLLTDAATGSQFVEHRWDHKRTYKLYLTESKGSLTKPIAEFLESCVDTVLKESVELVRDRDHDV